jgi:hypothetical protein
MSVEKYFEQNVKESVFFDLVTEVELNHPFIRNICLWKKEMMNLVVELIFYVVI